MKNRFRGLSESRKLEMLQLSVEEIYNAGYVAGYTKKSFEKQLDAVAKVKPKSPNQRRAELIQRAREFVKEHEKDLPGRWDCRDYGNRTCRAVQYETEFTIKDRKVTALIYLVQGLHKRVRSYKRPSLIGRAKCAPNEVFNADIGKAIALARALEIEIPQEFLNAVQPDFPVIGSVVRGKFAPAVQVIRITRECNETRYWREGTGGYVNSRCAVITDDTQAEYEVPSC